METDPALAHYAFDSIWCNFYPGPEPHLLRDHGFADGDRKVPGIFVTLTHVETDELRGCIGSLREVSLSEIRTYARKAAFEDSRFPPVRRHELEELELSVSVLHSFEEARHPRDWNVGTHGLILSLDGYNATYLPDAIMENYGDGGLWNSKRAVLESLAKKAGWTPVPMWAKPRRPSLTSSSKSDNRSNHADQTEKNRHENRRDSEMDGNDDTPDTSPSPNNVEDDDDSLDDWPAPWGRKDFERALERAQVTRYQTGKTSITYEDWISHRWHRQPDSGPRS
jgi:uncharacterized protein (TIGR00296 family)